MIYLHPKHGLNPTMTQCFYCGEAKDILLVGRRTAQFSRAGVPVRDGAMPHSIGVIDKEPCPKCKEFMEQGVILISTRDGEEGKDNPYRTGGWIVVKDEAIQRMLNNNELSQDILKARVAFVPDTVWDMVGLPRAEAAA